MKSFLASVRVRGGDRIKVKLVDCISHEVFFKRNVAIGDKKAIEQLKIDLKEKGCDL